MGRKKRKVDVSEATNNDDGETQAESSMLLTTAAEIVPTGTVTVTLVPTAPVSGTPRDPRRVKLEENSERSYDNNSSEKSIVVPSAVDEPASSGYAMTSHSGQLVPEDTYVSDGSSSEDEIEVVVTTSRMGIMRRGLYQSTVLPQANRQWSRQDAAKDLATTTGGEGVVIGGTTAGRGSGEPGDTAASGAAAEEAFLAKLDPTQRAAWLLAEKQRREAAAILEARRQENEDNASRDPTLFSKRTAFDIRFDQIDDKPWQRNGTQEQNLQHAEFFNYGLSEDDWLEYAEQQQLVRQELIDASRQKRPPDPSIVPVQIRPKDGSSVSTVAAPKAPVAVKDEMTDGNTTINAGETELATTDTSEDAGTTAIGALSQGSNSTALAAQLAPQQQESVSIPVGVGGAWGAGALPGSLLAKLMEEENNGSVTNDTPTNASRAPVTDRGSGAVKSERDVSYYGSHTPDDAGSSHRDGSGGGYHALPPPHEEDYHSRSGSGQWRPHRNAAPPDMDPYGGESGGWPSGGSSSDAYYAHSIPPPPPPPGNVGYYGGGSHRGDGGSGGYGFRGGRGGRGAYDGGGRGDYYSESSHTAWKRPRDGADQRRRR